MLNNGDGTFQDEDFYPVQYEPYSVFLVDLDGDGDNDLATANLMTDNVSILLNSTGPYVGIADDESQPIELFAHQSMPNPFTANAVIEYVLHVSAYVEIDVFDLMGRKVTSLVNDQQAGGCHQVTWSPNGMPPGIYFYVIQAGDYTCTEKMILLD
jgi:hypothetical protein